MKTVHPSKFARAVWCVWLALALLHAGVRDAGAGTILRVSEIGGDGAPFAQFTGNTFTGPAIGT